MDDAPRRMHVVEVAVVEQLPGAVLLAELEVEAAPGDERGLVGDAGQAEVRLEVDLHAAADPAALEGDHALAHPLDHLPIVGGHEHGGAAGVHVLEQGHDLLRHLGVEVARGLVGQQQHGLVDERAGDGHPLLLAARELQRVGVHLVVQADRLQSGERAPLLLLRGHGQDAQHEGHVLEDRLALQELEVLEDDADGPPQLGDLPLRDRGHVAPADQDLPLRRQLLAEHELQEGGLARPRGPGEEAELALVDVQRDVGQRRGLPVVLLVDVEGLDYGVTS